MIGRPIQELVELLEKQDDKTTGLSSAYLLHSIYAQVKADPEVPTVIVEAFKNDVQSHERIVDYTE